MYRSLFLIAMLFCIAFTPYYPPKAEAQSIGVAVSALRHICKRAEECLWGAIFTPFAPGAFEESGCAEFFESLAEWHGGEPEEVVDSLVQYCPNLSPKN